MGTQRGLCEQNLGRSQGKKRAKKELAKRESGLKHRDKMTSTAAPTIVRTTHKFGDYLTNPDRAKLELPKKMTRPWIVNNAYEQEKLKDFLSGDKPVDTRTVQGHIRETKKRKMVGTNRKYLRNINDIIAQDNTNAVNGNKGTKSKPKTCPATTTRAIVKE